MACATFVPAMRGGGRSRWDLDRKAYATDEGETVGALHARHGYAGDLQFHVRAREGAALSGLHPLSRFARRRDAAHPRTCGFRGGREVAARTHPCFCTRAPLAVAAPAVDTRQHPRLRL